MTKHYYNEPERSNALARNYDYVIVGAGSAGCVVARRLIDSTDATVLLLEAGVKFKTSPTTEKYRRCHSSIAEINYAAKAWQREKHSIGRITSPLVRND